MEKDDLTLTQAKARRVVRNIRVRRGVRETDHKTLVSLANMSRFTSAFSDDRFSSIEAYKKGWVRVAIYGNTIVGLSCVRHKKREPKTVLFFLIVHPTMRCHQVGARMLTDLRRQTPYKCIKLHVHRENPDAKKFCERNGYSVVGQTTPRGYGWEMERSW